MAMTAVLRKPISGRAVASVSRNITGSSSLSPPFRRQFGSESPPASRRAAAAFLGGRTSHENIFRRSIIGPNAARLPFHQYTRASSSGDKGTLPPKEETKSIAIETKDDEDASERGENEIDKNATSDEATEDDDPPPAYFPWRHEPDPPARILEKDDYSHMPNNFQARFIRRIVACKELNLRPWDAVPLPFGFAHEWEDDLASNFATAFGLALEELLSSVFAGRVSVTNNDERGIWVDSSEREEVVEGGDEGEGGDKGDDAKSFSGNQYLNSMFDRNLLEKYRILDPSKLQLRLNIMPISVKLQSIFAVPLITREIVEKKPHLRGSYQKIEREFAATKSYSTVKKMTYELADEIGKDNAYRRTVIADALITCSEFFQLRDLSSGLVLAGMEDGAERERVVHNVRFEVTTEKGEDGPRSRKMAGSWRIIDLDDALEGNVFH